MLILREGVSIIATYFPPGKAKNRAFSILGAGQPLGYIIGMILGVFLCVPTNFRQGSTFRHSHMVVRRIPHSIKRVMALNFLAPSGTQLHSLYTGVLRPSK